MESVWTAVISGVMSAGFAGVVTAFVTSRSMSRKIDAEARKIEVEADAAEQVIEPSVSVTNIKGSEAAVLLMSASLTSAHEEIERLSAARRNDQEYITQLTQRVNELQSLVAEAQESARRAQEYSERLQVELDAARRRMSD